MEIAKILNYIICLILLFNLVGAIAIGRILGDLIKTLFNNERLPNYICTKYMTEIMAIDKKKECKYNSIRYVIKITAKLIDKKKPHWICGEMEVDKECFEKTELKRLMELQDIAYFVNPNTVQYNIKPHKLP